MAVPAQDDDDAIAIDRAVVQQLRSKLSAHLHLSAYFLWRLVNTLVATEDLGFGLALVGVLLDLASLQPGHDFFRKGNRIWQAVYAVKDRFEQSRGGETFAKVCHLRTRCHLYLFYLTRHPEVIVAVVVGFSRTGDGHNHRGAILLTPFAMRL